MDFALSVISVIIGAIITAALMLSNSYSNARNKKRKERRYYIKAHVDDDISKIGNLYEDTIYTIQKVIRENAYLDPKEIDNLFKLGVQLRLKSTKEIYDEFNGLREEISKVGHNLPPVPDEPVLGFEDDKDRRHKEEMLAKAIKKRDEEANKYVDELYDYCFTLSDMMKNHIVEIINKSEEDND